MLSIVTLHVAKDARDYYEKDNYYTKDNEASQAASRWFGKGAALLGLSGPVNLNDFEQCLEGKLPNGVQLGRIEQGEIVHRPGYDLTFSAPKSVSILWGIGHDKRLETAHDEAVNLALDYVERQMMQTRLSRNNQVGFEQVDNLTAALFRHDISREQDPQLHTHCVLINAVLCEDRGWRSIASETLFQQKITAGVIYRAALAHQLKQRGYQLTLLPEGFFEIKGVPKPVLAHFSTRRAQIEETLNQRGESGGKAAAKAALETRAPKTTVDRDALHTRWVNDCQAHHFNPEPIIEASKTHEPEPSQYTAEEALNYAIAHCSEKESVFPDHLLIRAGLSLGLGDIQVADMERVIAQAYRDGRLLQTRNGWCTTPEAKHLEEHLITCMLAEQNTLEPLASESQINHYQGNIDITYTPGQRQAIQLILTNRDRFCGDSRRCRDG